MKLPNTAHAFPALADPRSHPRLPPLRRVGGGGAASQPRLATVAWRLVFGGWLPARRGA